MLLQKTISQKSRVNDKWYKYRYQKVHPKLLVLNTSTSKVSIMTEQKMKELMIQENFLLSFFESINFVHIQKLVIINIKDQVFNFPF